jgi:hypothetical protein
MHLLEARASVWLRILVPLCETVALAYRSNASRVKSQNGARAKKTLIERIRKTFSAPSALVSPEPARPFQALRPPPRPERSVTCVTLSTFSPQNSSYRLLRASRMNPASRASWVVDLLTGFVAIIVVPALSISIHAIGQDLGGCGP